MAKTVNIESAGIPQIISHLTSVQTIGSGIVPMDANG